MRFLGKKVFNIYYIAIIKLVYILAILTFFVDRMALLITARNRCDAFDTDKLHLFVALALVYSVVCASVGCCHKEMAMLSTGVEQLTPT